MTSISDLVADVMATDDISHSGVKGMKWGVRNDRGHEGESAKTKDIAKADKKYDKQFSSGINSWIKVQNEFANVVNPKLDVMNDLPKYKGKELKDGSKLQKDYLKDYEKLIDQSTSEVMKNFGTNASGTRQLKVTRDGEGYYSSWQAELVDVQHAAGDILGFKIIPKFNKSGHIIGQTIESLVAQHSMGGSETMADATEMDYDEFLEHFGVKGMKWGHRRQSRLDTLNRVASGKGDFTDKAHVALTEVSLASTLRRGGLKNQAKNRAAQLELRKARIEKGEGTVKDLLALHGADRMFIAGGKPR